MESNKKRRSSCFQNGKNLFFDAIFMVLKEGNFKRLQILKFPLFMTIFLLIISCTTSLQQYSVSPLTREVGAAQITIEPVSEEEMYSRIDRNINPYVKFPARASRNYIYVIEFNGTTTSDIIQIDYKQITLKIGDHESKAYTSDNLLQVWTPYIDNFEISQYRRKLEQTMVPEKIVIETGQNVSGYLVFWGSYPPSGNAILSIPAETLSGDTGTLIFEYTIKPLSEDEELPAPENTGIFAKK